VSDKTKQVSLRASYDEQSDTASPYLTRYYE